VDRGGRKGTRGHRTLRAFKKGLSGATGEQWGVRNQGGLEGTRNKLDGLTTGTNGALTNVGVENRLGLTVARVWAGEGRWVKSPGGTSKLSSQKNDRGKTPSPDAEKEQTTATPGGKASRNLKGRREIIRKRIEVNCKPKESS